MVEEMSWTVALLIVFVPAWTFLWVAIFAAQAQWFLTSGGKREILEDQAWWSMPGYFAVSMSIFGIAIVLPVTLIFDGARP